MAWALRDVINKFIILYSTLNLEKDKLTDMEWHTIRVIKDFLEKLLMLTKACESRESTLNLTLPSTDYILDLFKKIKTEYKDNPTFISMFNLG